MSVTSDDEIVVNDDPVTRDARLYRWFLDHLAKFPGRVTVVTFVAAAAVTVIVVIADGDASPTTIVSLMATLWALFFAVMIYLLTARDNDKVLDQIADLHEQLATALAAPDEDETGVAQDETGVSDREPSGAAVGLSDAPAAGPAREATGGDDTRRDRRPRGDGRGGPRPVYADGSQDRLPDAADARPRPHLLVGLPAILDGVPGDLLDAWTSATGRSRDELARAWTRDPRTDRQWVLETVGHERWVVFSKGSRGFGVMSLDGVGRGPRGRPRPRSG